MSLLSLIEPYETNNTELSVVEVRQILSNVHESRLTQRPAQCPKGGSIFVYDYSATNIRKGTSTVNTKRLWLILVPRSIYHNCFS